MKPALLLGSMVACLVLGLAAMVLLAAWLGVGNALLLGVYAVCGGGALAGALLGKRATGRRRRA